MEIQFTLSQIVGMATAITAIVTTYNLIRKPLKEREKTEKERDDKIDKLIANDREHLDKLDKAIDKIQESTDIQGDMIYAMLSHMATNNATGQMQNALDKYNAFYRKNH